MKVLFLGILTVLLIVSPALARTPLEGGANPPEVRFLECDHHYWLHRGMNDSLYYGGGGSFNSAQADRYQGRREAQGVLLLGPWRTVKTPIVTEWIEREKATEIPLEGANTP